MAPTAKKMQIAQETFDSVVRENVEDLGMDDAEALADAITTFKLQGVDLSGIVTDGGGTKSLATHPIILAIETLQTVVGTVNGQRFKSSAEAERSYESPGIGDAHLSPELESDIVSSISTLQLRCCDLESGDASLAEAHGGVEALLDTCKILTACKPSIIGNALAALSAILRDGRARDKFGQSSGPEVVVEALSMDQANDAIVQRSAAVISSASLKNEDVKDSFVSLKVHDVLSGHLKLYQSCPGVVIGVCDALRSLVTADDDRIAVSRAFQNGMLIAKAGVVDTLLDVAVHQDKTTAVLPSLCIALKNLAVNVMTQRKAAVVKLCREEAIEETAREWITSLDLVSGVYKDEICKSIAEKGGLKLAIEFLKTSVEQNHRVMARTSCILLTQLSCSDTNKDAIVQRHDGLRHIVDLTTNFSMEASVVQEALTALAVLTLRSPVNASQAVTAGVVELTAEVMEGHPGSPFLQRQACQLIRNLAVRNLENRPVILERGFEKLIKQAKAKHEVCRDAASAALRDLGFDDYNL